jgi:hypothetical protein
MKKWRFLAYKMRSQPVNQLSLFFYYYFFFLFLSPPWMGRLPGGRGHDGGCGSRGGHGGGRGGSRVRCGRGRGGGYRGGRGSAAEPPSLDMSVDMYRESSLQPSSKPSSQRQAQFLSRFEFARIPIEGHSMDQLRLPLKFARQLAGHEPT